MEVGEFGVGSDVVADPLPVEAVCGGVGAGVAGTVLEGLRGHVEFAELLGVGLRADVVGHDPADGAPGRVGARGSEVDGDLLKPLDPLVGLALFDEIVGQRVERRGAERLLGVVGVVGQGEPGLHRLLDVAVFRVALADPELGGGGILHVVGEEVDHLLVDLDRLKPLLQLLQR